MRVFIIHGRDHGARDEIVRFVRSLGLEVSLFESVASSLGGNPFVGDVVIRAIQDATAVIALFTPEEQSALYDAATGRYLGAKPHESRWQARPNVIFEAGVAFGISRDKTILVSLGSDVELFSDVSGLHIIDLSHPEAKDRLRTALAKLARDGELKPVTPHWKRAAVSGDFAKCLRPRWPHYDELSELEQTLGDTAIGKARVSMVDVLRAALRRDPRLASGASNARRVMQAIASDNPGIAEEAYWWLIVLGVFRFQDVERWWEDDDDGPSWQSSVGRAEIAPRGTRLLHKLSLAHTAISTP